MDAKSLRKILVRIAGETAGYLRDIVDQQDLAEAIGKGAAGDTTHRADKIAEETIIDLVRREDLPAKIVTEEGGIINVTTNPEYLLIIDPLDGSMNYLSKIPYAAVSLAISRIDNAVNTGILAGAIANIFLKEIYSFDDEHAYIDNTPILPDNLKPSVSNIVIVYTKTPSFFNLMKDFFTTHLPQGRLRVLGSASLELAYTGLSRILLFINNMGSLRNLDIVAAIKFAEKLGKKITDIHGNPISFRVDEIVRIDSVVAGEKHLVDKLISFIKAKEYAQVS